MTFDDIVDLAEKEGCDVSAIDGREYQTMWCDYYQLERFAALSLHEGNTLLNKHSGLAGISGVSSDMREIVDSAKAGNTNAKLALDVFCYRLKKYIGSYMTVLGGLDGLVFTAGIGENSAVVRSETCKGLEFAGISIDSVANESAIGKEVDISSSNAKVRTLVIPTNEELVIAHDTERIVKG